MQEREKSGNITPAPNVNEIEAPDMTENQMGERSHVNDDAYRQQKESSKITYEESVLEIIKEKVEMILMKTNLF